MEAQVERLVKQGCDLSFRHVYILLRCNSDGDMTIKALSDGTNGRYDKPSVSRDVQRLLDQGYVDRRTHPEDRRSVLVSLTKAGRKFIRAAIKP
jgi:DNA-binding MarR family transcriptional regulator